MTTVILAVVGLLLGLGIGFLFSAYQSRDRMERLRSDAAVLQMRYDAAEKGRQEGLQALDAARAETERVRAKRKPILPRPRPKCAKRPNAIRTN